MLVANEKGFNSVLPPGLKLNPEKPPVVEVLPPSEKFGDEGEGFMPPVAGKAEKGFKVVVGSVVGLSSSVNPLEDELRTPGTQAKHTHVQWKSMNYQILLNMFYLLSISVLHKLDLTLIYVLQYEWSQMIC